MTLGERIRKLREERGMTQDELGKKLGVQKSTISMYEHGHREPAIQKLIALSTLFDIDMNELLGIGAFVLQDPQQQELDQEPKVDDPLPKE